MSLVLPLLGMVAAGIGTGVQASQNAKALQLASDNYNKQRSSLLTEKYQSAFDYNKPLLTQMERTLQKNEQKIENQATAGGATVENVLAAKQASNEAMADVYSNVLQADQQRRDAYTQQLLNLDSQRTAQQMAAKQASGQAWANLGNAIFGGLTTLGGTLLDSKLSSTPSPQIYINTTGTQG